MDKTIIPHRKTAAIYARVSTAEQVKGTSLDGQVESCQDYAKEHGYSVVKVMQEDASGTRLDRAKLGELRNMAERREIEALIVFDPDRLSRSMTHTMMLMDEFERNRAGILFVNAPKEDTPEGNMLFGMKTLFAEYERTKILERTRRGKERRAREGKVICSERSAPYGYSYKAGAFEIVELEAQWVNKMFAWVAFEHCNFGEVRRRLELMDAPTRRGSKYWYQSTIGQIIANSIYAGEWYWNKREAAVPHTRRAKGESKREKSSHIGRPKEEWIAVPTPAILTMETYEIAQRQVARNKTMSPRNSKREYLLSGLLFCKQCSRRLAGGAMSNAKSRYYRCTSRQRPDLHAGCLTKSVNADNVENLVWSALIKYLSDPNIILADLENSNHLNGQERLREDADMAALVGSELSLKAEDDRQLDAYGKGVIDIAQLQERLDITRKQRGGLQTLRADIEKRMAQRANAKASRAKVEELCKHSQRGLHLLPYAEKREYLQALEVKGTVDGDKLLITGIIQDIVLSLNDKHEAESDVFAYTLSSA